MRHAQAHWSYDKVVSETLGDTPSIPPPGSTTCDHEHFVVSRLQQTARCGQEQSDRILRSADAGVYDVACVKKSIHSAEYRVVLQTLVGMRRKAGLTQRALAGRLGREQSFVWRIETGEHRIDVVEFSWVCRAMGFDPASIFADMAGQWDCRAPAPATAIPRAAEPGGHPSTPPAKRPKPYPSRHRRA